MTLKESASPSAPDIQRGMRLNTAREAIARRRSVDGTEEGLGMFRASVFMRSAVVFT
jgi:hypothetical protein